MPTSRVSAVLLKHLCALFLLAFLPSILLTSAFAETWREVRSPHFRVITEGSERDGQAVAREFEQMRYIFETRFVHASLESEPPLRIIAVRESGLHQMGPHLWKDHERIAGMFLNGWENQFALVRLDVFGELNQAVVFHEYTHTILHANYHWLPTWLDEGTAEFYAYTRFQGDRTYLGAPSIRWRALRQGSFIPAAEMLVATPNSYEKDERRAELFYAESWAMVHFMTFGKDMEGGAKLNRFLKAIENGTPQVTAFQQIFGDPKIFDDDFSSYLNRLSTFAAVLPPAPNLDVKTFTTRTLTAAQVDYELGSIAERAHDSATARTKLEAAIAQDANLAPAHEELGYLDFQQGRDNDAREQWSRAVSLDPTRYRASFALLMTASPQRDQTPDQLHETQKALQHITEIAPKYAPPYAELAIVDWRLHQMQDAYKASRIAEQLAPWRAGYHLLTGNILLKGNQSAAAANYARTVAGQWPGTDHNEAVALWSRLPTAARGDGPPLTMSLPEGSTLVFGKLLSTACDKGPDQHRFEVTLQPAGAAAPITLSPDGRFESGFSDTLWFGEDHYTICHHLDGLPALAAYTSTPSGIKLTSFQVFDDLPGVEPFPSPEKTVAVAAAAHP